MATYETPIILGHKYRDEQTGLQGTAIAVTFWQHSCERVIIEFVNEKDGKLEELTFDRPRMVPVEPERQSEKPPRRNNGGPGGSSRDSSARRGGAR